MNEKDLIAREAGKTGMRGKINAKCIDCIYDPLLLGSWRKQTDQCQDTTCPLWAIRPRSMAMSEKRQEGSI